MARSNFFNDFAKLVTPALAEFGFQKEGKYPGIYHLPVAPGIAGWLGLNHGYYAGVDEVSLTVKVGLRADPLEALVREFLPTVGLQDVSVVMTMTDLGELETVAFDRDHQREGAARLVEQVERVAVPWMRSQTDIAAVVRSIQHPGNHAQPELREPLALLLLGDRVEAIRVAQAAADQVAGRTDRLAAGARELVAKLEAGAH